METLALKVQGFEIQGKEGSLRLEVFLKGKHGLECRHFTGKSLTLEPVLGVACTLTGEIMCTPWPQELNITVWPSDDLLHARMSALLGLLLPGLTDRVLVTVKMDEVIL
jgi:hypothetical protein